MTLFILENTAESGQRRLFTILGTEFRATPLAWVNLPMSVGFGILIAVLFAPVDSFGSQVMVGIGYGLLMIASTYVHALGHIISSRLVNAPMTALIATATVNTTHYDDKEVYPSRVHVGRALGGPAFSLILGVVALALAGDSHALRFLGIVNLVLVAITLSPLPTLDGAIVLRELRNWKR